MESEGTMKKALITLFCLLYATASLATATAAERFAAYEKHRLLQKQSLFPDIKWREVGPYFQGGRLVDIEAYEDSPFTILIAAASGGLWKTESNGTTWTALFDSESAITIGDIAISQKDKNLIWVGTGEANSLRSAYAGTGVFKSIDGGRSWKHMGLSDTHHIARVLIDPTETNIVYIAAMGHLYTENEERGLFKSTDGGQTWNKILFISAKTGIIDLVMHPDNTRILYAAAWEKDRKAWNMIESGPESAIYKSEDAGATWVRLAGGFPAGDSVGRIGLAVTPAAPDSVFAFLDNQESRTPEKKDKPTDANSALFRTNIKGAEVYRSDDGGANWKRTHDKYLANNIINTYGYFFGQIRVSPTDASTVYILGVPAMKSTDGGQTFREIPPGGGSYGKGGEDVHPDHHALWIDPHNADHLLLGNDGGLNISYDGGKSFQKINNLPLAQCYTIQTDFADPYNIYAGLQDNGVNVGPSTFRYGDVGNIWKMILGGDGAFTALHADDPDYVYAAFQFGNITRLNLKKPRWSKHLQPTSKDKNAPYRFNWLTPFFTSRHDPYTVFLGANKVLRMTAPQDEWRELSPDLTDGLHTDGDVPYATITALDQSPLAADLLYAGTDDGNVWVTLNGGKKWDKINAGLPKKWVTRLTASRFQKNRVYLSLTGYRDDDFSAYLFASDNAGTTWKSIRGNLPDEPVNVIREDPVNQNILFLGTDLTVYVSLDRGLSWQSLRGNLPTNTVYDLQVHPRERELIIGTHGRGVHVLPISRIQELSPEILAKTLHLFPAELVRQQSAEPWQGMQRAMKFEFYLKTAQEVVLEINDATNKPIRRIVHAGKPGLNALFWDLKTDKGTSPVVNGDYWLSAKAGRTSATITVLLTN